MKIITLLIILLFPVVVYYNHYESNKAIREHYTNVHFNVVADMGSYLNHTVKTFYNVCNTFAEKNRLDYEYLMILKKTLPWNIASISIVDANKKITESTNKYNKGMQLKELTRIKYDKSKVINTSSPYIVKMNDNQELFVDILFPIDDDKFCLLRLNVSHIYTPTQQDSFLFLIDKRSGLPILPVIPGLESRYEESINQNDKYLQNEYTPAHTTIHDIPQTIINSILTNKKSEEYIYSNYYVEDIGWEVVSIVIPFNTNNYSLLGVYAVCSVLILILLYFIRDNSKQMMMVTDYVGKEYEKYSSSNQLVIEQVDRLACKLDGMREENKSYRDEKQLEEMVKKQERQTIADDLSTPVNSMYKNSKVIEDQIYKLYSKIEENSLQIVLLYFVIRHIVGTKISEVEDILLSLDNKKILDDFRSYLEKENYINIDPKLLTKDNLEKLLKIFSEDLEYLAKFIQEDYILVNDKLNKVVNNINEVQEITLTIKPHLSTIFDDIQQIHGMIEKINKE